MTPSASPIDLTTLANAKAWVNVASPNDDAIIQRLVTAQSQGVLNYLNRPIAQTTYTETYDGNGLDLLMLGNYPISSITSLSIDGQAITARPALGQSGYTFDSDTIYLDGYTFNRGRANIVVTYVAGYAVVPFDLEQAVIELVALRYKERDHIGHVSKAIQGETVAYIQKDMPDDVRTVLDNYRRVVASAAR